MAGPVLDPIQRPWLSVTAGGAYDAEPVYHAGTERQPYAPPAAILPPRATAVLGPTSGTVPTLTAQRTEARLACSVIHRMTPLGMPLSQRV